MFVPQGFLTMSLAVYALCSLVVISQALSGVRGITNAEFFDQLKDYITDLEVQESDASSAINYDVSDVIELPGGPDDEIDLVYLFRKIGFTLTEETSGLKPYVSDVATPVKENLLGGCSCRRLNCNCCGSQTFSVNLWFKKITATVSGCVSVEYLERNKGFMITITINGRQVYRKEISLRNPPALCYGIPGLQGFARVCLQFYDVDLGSRRACAKLVGVIDLKVKKFSVSLGLGCFGIPIVEDESSLEVASLMLHEGNDPYRKTEHVLFRHVQYLEIKESSHQNDKIGTAEGHTEDDLLTNESDAELDVK